MMGKRPRWSSKASGDYDEDADADDLVTMNGDLETLRDVEARRASDRRKRKSVTIAEASDEILGENLLLDDTTEEYLNHNFRQDGISMNAKMRLENNSSFVSNHQSIDCSNSSRYFRSLDSAEHVSTPLRKRNSCPSQSGDSTDGSGDMIGSRPPLGRRTSQSLAEAFIEQLPEVRSGARDHMTSV